MSFAAELDLGIATRRRKEQDKIRQHTNRGGVSIRDRAGAAFSIDQFFCEALTGDGHTINKRLFVRLLLAELTLLTLFATGLPTYFRIQI